MVTATGARSSTSDGLRRTILIVIGLTALYFVYESVLPYFTWDEAAYGYYWQFRLSLIAHVSGGMVALLAGVWQIWTGLNTQSMGIHPWTGRLYVSGVLLGSIAAFWLAATSSLFGFAWSVSLICLGVAWLATTGMALYGIRKRALLLHKQWMIRSYIVTFAFVMFRILTNHVPYEEWWGISAPEMSNAVIWPIWVMPLLAYEMILAGRRA